MATMRNVQVWLDGPEGTTDGIGVLRAAEINKRGVNVIIELADGTWIILDLKFLDEEVTA